MKAAAGVVLFAALVAGCAGPTVSTDATGQATRSSLQAMVSALNTSELAADTQLRGRAWWQYTDVAVTDAESEATSVASGYTSRQPPAESADLYHRASQELSTASSLVTQLRVAVRHHDAVQVARLLPELRSTAEDLESQAQVLR